MTAALMFQGTGSDVGKSMLVAGLARAFSLRGLKVRPFKPQNMSNNAAVTADGGEIGRAQALQARACGVEPCVHMNPVLLKPQSEVGAQVVVQGRVIGNARARDYQKMKPTLMPQVMDSYRTLQKDADLILIEGAGSAAELNLRAGDIANMGFACEAKVPVVLIADIERGGVLASIVGTHQLLPPQERSLLVGYIVNKFRGDASLFDSAIDIVAERSGLNCFGVVPWFHRAGELPAEDAMNVRSSTAQQGKTMIKIVVPILSRMANFDDLDPLIAEADVDVQFITAGQALPGDADLIVLPGSKSTLADLAFLREQGWDIDIAAHVRRGGWLLGICAGFQMLGKTLSDPLGIEGDARQDVQGLGYIDVHTEMSTQKRLQRCSAIDNESSQPLTGYEMHIGTTQGEDLAQAMLSIDGKPHGVLAMDGKVMGCYLHGLFASDPYRHAFLNRISAREPGGVMYEKMVDSALDALAQHLQQNIDLDALLECATQGLSAAPGSTVVPQAQRWQ